jgi:hypothetical protein
VPRRPYPGLRPFEKDEWPIFRGRERLVEDVLTVLNRHHFASIVGPSGSGKSSLVRAGVLATLERRHGRMGVTWRTAAMRPGASPLWSMADAISRSLRPESVGQDNKPPAAQVARLRALIDISEDGLAVVRREYELEESENFLLLVDQFEEIFRYKPREEDRERTRLIELLLAVAKKKPAGIHVITTMRTEYLGECARFAGLAETLNETHYLVPRMTDKELRQAIVEPAELAKGKIHPALVDRLISDVRAQEDQLPILQHTLLWLWIQQEEKQLTHPGAHASIELTLPEYEQLGGASKGGKADNVKSALSRHGDKILDSMTPEERRVAEIMFRRMVEVEEHSSRLRRPTRRSTVARLAGVSPDVVDRVISAFRADDASFIRAERQGDETSIDIMHESLIRQWETLDGWRRRECQSYGVYYDLCRSQRRMRDRLRGPLVGLDLSQTWSWFQEERPTRLWARRYNSNFGGDFGAAIDFLNMSKQAEDDAQKRAEQEEERKREEQLERERSGRAQAEAQAARFLALRGRAALERAGPTRALLIALEGLTREEVRYAPEMEALAYDALQQLRERRVIRIAMLQPTIEFFPQDDTLLLTAAADGWLHLWHSVDGSEIGKKSVYTSYIRAKCDVGGTRILAGSTTGEASVLPVASGKSNLPAFGRPVKFGDKANRAGPGMFSPDGSLILTGNVALSPIMWDATTLPPKAVWHGEGAGFALAFSSDGERFATGGNDGIIRVYLTKTKELLKERRSTIPIVSLQFHPTDHDMLLATSFGAGAFIWSIGEQKRKAAEGKKGLRDLKGPRGFVLQGAFSQDGSLVATAAEDGVWLWRTSDLEAPIVLKGHQGTLFSLSFDRAGEAIASTSSDETIRIWSIDPVLRTGIRRVAPPIDTRRPPDVSDVLAQEGGRELAWDTSASPPELRVLGRHQPITLGQPRGFAKPVAAAFAPRSNFVLVAPAGHGRPLLYDLDFPEAPVAAFGEVNAAWRSVAFAPDLGHPTGMTVTGEEHAWTYFPERAQLIEFAREHLPREGGAPVSLSEDELNQLGLAPA